MLYFLDALLFELPKKFKSSKTVVQQLINYNDAHIEKN